MAARHWHNCWSVVGCSQTGGNLKDLNFIFYLNQLELLAPAPSNPGSLQYLPPCPLLLFLKYYYYYYAVYLHLPPSPLHLLFLNLPSWFQHATTQVITSFSLFFRLLKNMIKSNKNMILLTMTFQLIGSCSILIVCHISVSDGSSDDVKKRLW